MKFNMIRNTIMPHSGYNLGHLRSFYKVFYHAQNIFNRYYVICNMNISFHEHNYNISIIVYSNNFTCLLATVHLRKVTVFLPVT